MPPVLSQANRIQDACEHSQGDEDYGPERRGSKQDGFAMHTGEFALYLLQFEVAKAMVSLRPCWNLQKCACDHSGHQLCLYW